MNKFMSVIDKVFSTVFDTKLFWGITTGDIIITFLLATWAIRAYEIGGNWWCLVFFAAGMYLTVRMQGYILDVRSQLIDDYMEMLDECIDGRERQHAVVVGLLEDITARDERIKILENQPNQ